MTTKTLTLDQGARTPVLNKSNFQALLTPNGHGRKAGILELCPSTPLLDEVENKRMKLSTIFT